jgi:uncharacterized protein YggE
MRRTRIRSVLAITAVALALGGSMAPSALASDRYIGVSATGTVKVKPDTVRLNANVAVIASANKDALAGASASAAKLRTALGANGVMPTYIKSTTLTVFPEYNYTADKGSTLIGYRASQTFEVIIRNANNAGVVVDAVVSAVGDSLTIDGVTPFVYDNTSATQKARVDAVARAKAKATSYARLLGVKLGKVTYLEESSSPSPFPVMMAMAKSDAGATQIDLGQQDVSISIVARWSIA